MVDSLLNHLEWSHSATPLLISTYAEVTDETSDQVKKKRLWTIIAERINSHGYNYTGQECDNKWRSLLKTYRAHVLHYDDIVLY